MVQFFTWIFAYRARTVHLFIVDRLKELRLCFHYSTSTYWIPFLSLESDQRESISVGIVWLVSLMGLWDLLDPSVGSVGFVGSVASVGLCQSVGFIGSLGSVGSSGSVSPVNVPCDSSSVKPELPQQGQWIEIRCAVVYILGCVDTRIVSKVLTAAVIRFNSDAGTLKCAIYIKERLS